jgi:hypothetical protein
MSFAVATTMGNAKKARRAQLTMTCSSPFPTAVDSLLADSHLSSVTTISTPYDSYSLFFDTPYERIVANTNPPKLPTINDRQSTNQIMIFTTILRTIFLLASTSLPVPIRHTAAVSLVLLASLPTTAVNAYALSPELIDVIRRDEYPTPCPDETTATGSVDSANVTPPTVTVTIFVPPSPSSHAVNSTATLSATSSSATRTSGLTSTTSATNSPGSVSALVVIAQEAQQLNAEFRSLTTGDSCTRKSFSYNPKR